MEKIKDRCIKKAVVFSIITICVFVAVAPAVTSQVETNENDMDVIVCTEGGSNGWIREDVNNLGSVEFWDLVAISLHYGESG